MKNKILKQNIIVREEEKFNRNIQKSFTEIILRILDFLLQLNI